MKNKVILFAFFVLVSLHTFSQNFKFMGKLNPTKSNFELLGISKATGVASYKYIGPKTLENYLYLRVADVIVGLKNGVIVTIIYNLYPEKNEDGIPKSSIELMKEAFSTLTFRFQKGMYIANTKNESIALSRTNNSLTFHKDRIMFMISTKHSLLIK